MSDAFALPVRRSRRRGLLVGGTLGAPVLFTGALLLAAAITTTSLCTDTGQLVGAIGDPRGRLTPELTRAINTVAARFAVDPYIVGALAMRETAGGSAISCSPAGACGALQLMPAFWAANRCDGDADGQLAIDDVDDNVCAAVNGLVNDKRTLIVGRHMTRSEIATMARSYCGSCTDPACGGGVHGGYCEGVVRNFERLGGSFGDGTANAALTPIPPDTTATAGACSASAAEPPPGAPAGWTVAPGANRPGRPLSAQLVAFLDRVAALTSYPPVLTTGTNHPTYTVDGNVSEHSTGHAADFGSVANHFGTSAAQPGQPVPRGDELAAAALIAADIDPARARALALAGGLRNVTFSFAGQPVRLQLIWKTSDHQDHVHIGVRPNG